MTTENDVYINELSKCVRCGSCKALCPTYESDATEAMSARGRLVLLRALATGQIKPSPLLNERIFSCILCGACEGLCPLGIDIPEAIYRGRALLSRTDKERRILRSLIKFSTRRPEVSFKMLRWSRHILSPLLLKKGLLPFNLDYPDTPMKGADQVYRGEGKKGRVAIFPGCSVNFLFPNLGEALIHVLISFGYEVVIPKGLVCCGTPLRTLGLEDETVAHAKTNFKVLSRLKVESVLSLCPTCTLMLNTEYQKIIGKGLEKAVDISVFFHETLDMTFPIQKTAVYHDPCHLMYGLKVRKEPRDIIQKAGIDLIEPKIQGCCGFGGLFCLSHGDMSKKLLDIRTKYILETEADTVVTSCPGCMLQLNRTITDRPVLHLIELIEEAYCHRSEDSKTEKVGVRT